MPGRWYLLFRTNCFIADMAARRQFSSYPHKQGILPCRDLNKRLSYYNYRKVGYGNEEAKQRFMEENKITDINDSFMHSELIPGKRALLLSGLGWYLGTWDP